MTFQQNFLYNNHISCLWPDLHEVEEDIGGITAEQEGCQANDSSSRITRPYVQQLEKKTTNRTYRNVKRQALKTDFIVGQKHFFP